MNRAVLLYIIVCSVLLCYVQFSLALNGGAGTLLVAPPLPDNSTPRARLLSNQPVSLSGPDTPSPGLNVVQKTGQNRPEPPWNRAQSERRAPPWTTGTTGRPGTATWTCWRRLHGRSWTPRTRMGWHRPCGPRTTATWRRCGSSWAEGESEEQNQELETVTESYLIQDHSLSLFY